MTKHYEKHQFGGRCRFDPFVHLVQHLLKLFFNEIKLNQLNKISTLNCLSRLLLVL